MFAPIAVPTQAGSSKDPEPVPANTHQVHPEGATTLATAAIPFSGCAIPTMVIVSLVPLHPGTGQVRLRLLVYPAIFLIDVTIIVSTLP